MNMTPWPTKTLSSIVTPSQTKVWLEILQFFPIRAFFCTSTKAPTLVFAPTSHPCPASHPARCRDDRSQLDRPPSGRERVIGSFQEFDDSQTGHAVVDRS